MKELWQEEQIKGFVLAEGLILTASIIGCIFFPIPAVGITGAFVGVNAIAFGSAYLEKRN